MKKISTILALFVFINISCYSVDHSKSKFQYNIANNINLNAYKFIFLAPLTYGNGSSDIYHILPTASHILTSIGFKVIANMQLESLNQTEIYQTLIFSIQHKQDNSNIDLQVEIMDWRGNPVYDCDVSVRNRGQIEESLNAALNEALKGFSENYSGFDASKAINPEMDIRKRYPQWEEINYNEEQLKQYLDNNKANLNNIEGIWSSIDDNLYKIGIVKSHKTDRDFDGFILQTENLNWLPKYLKMEIMKTAFQKIYKVKYYMGDHSVQNVSIVLNNEGLIEIVTKKPDGTEQKVSFIKMYPSFSEVGNNTHSNQQVSIGSGFIVSKSGLVVTNWHVISNATQFKISIPNLNKSFKGTLVVKDTSNDIAIIRMEGFIYNDIFSKDIPYKLITSKDVKQGQQTITMGFPLGDVLGEGSKVSQGIISSISGIDGDPRLFQISNPVQPGNSGGPLFDMYGNVIGIVVSSLNAKYFYEKADILPQNVNFAVKSDYVLSLIPMIHENLNISDLKSSQIHSVENLVELFAPYVVKIEAEN